jgi:hypothetical protein
MITEDTANAILAPLVVAFDFTEDQYVLWRDMITGLDDAGSAQAAAAQLIRQARSRFVPGWGMFQEAYDSWSRRARARAEEERLQLEDSASKRFPTFEEGVAIARQAYMEDCERLNRPIDLSHFDAWLGQGREERRTAQRKRNRW